MIEAEGAGAAGPLGTYGGGGGGRANETLEQKVARLENELLHIRMELPRIIEQALRNRQIVLTMTEHHHGGAGGGNGYASGSRRA